LVDKFVRGGAVPGAEGGSDDAIVTSHGHTIPEEPAHTHPLPAYVYHATQTTNRLADGAGDVLMGISSDAAGAHTHGGTVTDTGESGTGKNMPAYYTLVYIKKIA